MNRRESIKALLATAAGSRFLSHGQRKSSTGLDRYGGWKGKRFRPTGFFRVAKDQRWWLVTPDGHAFLSFGINHLHSDLFRQAHNRSAWQKRLGLENIDDYSQFAPALRKWFLQTCEDYGFNTVGVHNALPIVNRPWPEVPYMQPIQFVDIPHWQTDIPDENFLDVFAPEFESRCEKLASDIAAPLKEDSYLIGYTMTDCPLLTEEDCRERPDVIGGARRPSRIGWPRRLRNLGSNAPGKQAYIRVMRTLYNDRIADFNTTYDTRFQSFNALATAVDWRPYTDLSNANETRDNTAFLQTVVAQYYKSARDAIRRHDPNHMFIGDKLNANTDSLDTVLRTTTRYTDLVLYQMYARYEVQKPGLDRWSKIVDTPFINGDSAFTMITDTMPRPFGPVADTLEQRTVWTEEFFRNAFARPEFVGWHYCGLIDATNQIARKQARQHSGLLDSYGEPYSTLRSTLRRCAEELYAIGTNSA